MSQSPLSKGSEVGSSQMNWVLHYESGMSKQLNSSAIEPLVFKEWTLSIAPPDQVTY